MPTVTTTFLDKKLEAFDRRLEKRLEHMTDAILGVMKQGFDEQARRMDRIEEALASLTESVDRFIKKVMDHDQELIVLRKQLHDMEERIDRLELKVKPS